MSNTIPERLIAQGLAGLGWLPMPPRTIAKTHIANLRDLRRVARLTQTQVAVKIGVPQSQYSKWERKAVMPDGKYLPAIVAAFNLSSLKQLSIVTDSKGQQGTSKDSDLPRHTRRVTTPPALPTKAGDDVSQSHSIRGDDSRLVLIEARLAALEDLVEKGRRARRSVSGTRTTGTGRAKRS